MDSVFCSPLRYVQGAGATERLGAEMLAVGLQGPALFVAGNSAVGRLAPVWAKSLAGIGWMHRVWLFGGESSRREIAAIAAEARSLGAATIVAAGGGKVLDAARAAAAILRLPFVSCPTVCSTDAPTSALSVIYHDDGPGRGSFEAYDIHRRSPDLVLVDTQVIAESPLRFLTAGIGDAMSTFYEARATFAAGRPNMRGGRSTLAALELARLCRDTVFADGKAAVAECRQRRVGEALERIVEATTLLSGLGFESSGLAAAHAIHNGLTAVPETHGMLHGEKVAFGTLVQLAMEALAAGVSPPLASSPHVAEAVAVADFFVAVGLPVTLGELGIGGVDGATQADPLAQAVERIAARATVAGETIHNMPIPVDAARVTAAITAADGLGRARLAAAAG
jgi:glycerol dehydrogenase